MSPKYKIKSPSLVGNNKKYGILVTVIFIYLWEISDIIFYILHELASMCVFTSHAF